MPEMQNVNSGERKFTVQGCSSLMLLTFKTFRRHSFVSGWRSTLCLCIRRAHHLRLWVDCQRCRYCASLVLAHWLFCDTVFMMTFLSLFYALGSEEGAVFSPFPWGVFAPGRVCLHGGHVALPLRLHHHIHSASQVRRMDHFNSVEVDAWNRVGNIHLSASTFKTTDRCEWHWSWDNAAL